MRHLRHASSAMPVVPVGLLAALLIAIPGCGRITSGLRIDPGATFELGENEHGSFVAAIQNRGEVPVELVAGEAGAESSTPVGTIAPGESVRRRFAGGESARLVNRGDDVARLRVEITGDTDLSMGYEPTSR